MIKSQAAGVANIVESHILSNPLKKTNEDVFWGDK